MKPRTRVDGRLRSTARPWITRTRPGTPDIEDPSSRRRPSSLRTPQLQICPFRTRFCPNLGRFAPQISFPDFGRPETRDFAKSSLASGLHDASYSARERRSFFAFYPAPTDPFIRSSLRKGPNATLLKCQRKNAVIRRASDFATKCRREQNQRTRQEALHAS